ncbi:MAG: hypothetical protein Q3999_05075 [Buchananella hordeovulneris]|nr:hypothetical protein [Buchananella hordeovulneris]
MRDIWRPGSGLTLRRAAALIAHLPPGSAYLRALGGPGAWSVEQYAIELAAWRITAAIYLANGAKKSDLPPVPEPPAPGWQDEARRRAEQLERRYARFMAAQKTAAPAGG